MNIKPIETVYKGYRFRSRLEARYAVFFDRIGIIWRYEDEGFEMGDGTRYLPDFYLPDFDLYFEVKPAWPNEIDLDKIRKFHEAGKIIALAIGLPNDTPLYLFLYEVDDGGGGAIEGQGNWVTINNKTFIEFKSSRERTFYSDSDMQHESEKIIIEPNARYTDAQYAAMIAKQARFEHGEQPWTTSTTSSPNMTS